MNKQTLDEIRAIICEEYINKKEEILKDEISGKIDTKRALEQRMKLIGMMMVVEIIQKEYVKAEDQKWGENMFKWIVKLFNKEKSKYEIIDYKFKVTQCKFGNYVDKLYKIKYIETGKEKWVDEYYINS